MLEVRRGSSDEVPKRRHGITGEATARRGPYKNTDDYDTTEIWCLRPLADAPISYCKGRCKMPVLLPPMWAPPRLSGGPGRPLPCGLDPVFQEGPVLLESAACLPVLLTCPPMWAPPRLSGGRCC